MNHSKQITILSVAVAVLFVLVLLLLYLNFYKTPTLISTPQPGIIPTTVPSSDPTTDWKTYTSSKFNYSFKYPQNWFIFDFDNTGRMVKISSQEMSVKPCGMGPCYENSIEFNLTDKPLLEVQVNDPVGTKKNEMMAQGNYVVKTQDLTVGGKTAARMEIRSTGNNYVAYWYEIDLGQKKVMKISNSEQDPITLSVLNQILSTFKFTNNSITTIPSNWKTYKNNQFGFEFQYPPIFVSAKDIEIYQDPKDILSYNLATADYQHFQNYEGIGNPYKDGYQLNISIRDNKCESIQQNDTDIFEVKKSFINEYPVQTYLFKWEVAYNWTLLVDYKKQCLSLTLNPGMSKNDPSKQLFDSLVSTLKFL